jgi:hypothetical protein
MVLISVVSINKVTHTWQINLEWTVSQLKEYISIKICNLSHDWCLSYNNSNLNDNNAILRDCGVSMYSWLYML